MSKWHLIQDQPLLKEIYKEPPIISYNPYKKRKIAGRYPHQSKTIRSRNTLSQAYESCLACQHLPPKYGISVTESQTFLFAKSCQRQGARRNGCYGRLIPSLPISYTQQHEISAKSLPHSMTSWPVSANISRNKSFSKIQQVTTKSMNEGSQNQPGNL